MPSYLPEIPIPRAGRLRFLAERTIRILPEPIGISIVSMYRYRHKFGYYPNIFRPKTFNEKIQARKIFDRREHLCLWADKYAVRDYVKAKVGPNVLANLYHVTTNSSDIPFDKLPRQYVVKPTHGSGWVQIVKNGDAINREELIDRCRRWLSLNYFDVTKEWAYKAVKPRILIEEFLDPGDGNPPNDFKIFVFGGQARAIQVDVGRHANHTRNLYDTDWNRIACQYGRYRNCAEEVSKPDSLAAMIRYAEILSDNVDFVRVDFYDIQGKVYFGELTNTPGSGLGKFEPRSWDATFGDFWELRMRHQTGRSRALPNAH